MNIFTAAEAAYLRTRRLGRLATAGPDGTPHVTPVGWSLDAAGMVIEVGGHDLTATKKFRDVFRTGRAAIVIDDLETVDPWKPRGIEIRGRAEALDAPPRIRIHPERIVSWGLEGSGRRIARDVPRSD